MAIQFKGTAAQPPKDFIRPPGDYDLRIVETKEDTDTEGRDILDVTFRIVDKDGTDGPKFRERFWKTAKAFWKIEDLFRSCGKHPGEGQDITAEADDMLGWECKARLGIRKTPEGGQFNEIKHFLFEEF